MIELDKSQTVAKWAGSVRIGQMDLKHLLEMVSSDKSPGVCADSQSVGAGDVFVAICGSETDGHEFIEKAIEAEAKYVVCEKPTDINGGEVIVVDDSAIAYSQLVQARHGRCCDKLINLAVTGTNGKTTVAFLVRHVLDRAGEKCGLIGTVCYDDGSGKLEAAELTTPDAGKIAELQSRMVSNGAKYMMAEASSHSLVQKRLSGIEFSAAAFTNLTGDHLDYHKTKEEYLAAKNVLFESLTENTTAVLNMNADESKHIAKNTKAKVLWYGLDCKADIAALVNKMDIDGAEFDLCFDGQRCPVKSPLVGEYNVSNLLAAAGICLSVGLDLDTVAKGLTDFKSVPGRLERVDCGQKFGVFVDYAHTDDALKNVLGAIKPLCEGKLIVVFGCGGDRDKTKRPRMAKVAKSLADLVIVTSDNPRTENPTAIIADISAGFKNPGAKNIFIEADRKTAINLALEKAGENDIVLIAGKGHEDYQILGKEKIHFSDAKVVAEFFGVKQ